jgi:TPR repeat protein
MKFNRWLGLLLILLAGSATQLRGQATDTERKQFNAIKARADKGNGEAQLSLALYYASGIDVPKDPKKAAKWLRKAADQGVARAQCLLGLAYANGQGVKPDKTEGARWLRRAADQGLAEAQFDLGMCYANGDGVTRDAVEAVDLYRKAADQGLPDAQCELGNCYLEGIGVPKDIPEGVKWTRMAAEQGFGPAENALGLCYTKGTGVTKDYLEAYKWFNLAAAKGDEQADDARVNLASTERFMTPEQIAKAQALAHEFKLHKVSASDETASPQASTAPQPPESGTGQPSTRDSTSVFAGTSKTGFVNVSAQDESCEIFVDGAFVGNTPARVKLSEGAHVVEVKKPGFKDYRRQIKMTEGSELTLRAALEKQ